MRWYKKISIIIDTYSIEKYIERFINSIINQMLKKIEIIIVNYGSTENKLNKIENNKYIIGIRKAKVI